jgi:hypothetical protein
MDIAITPRENDTFEITITDSGTQRSAHRVTVPPDMLERYGAGSSAEDLLRESFAFLLEREPPESILRSFTIDVIERYFPDYPQEIRKRLTSG